MTIIPYRDTVEHGLFATRAPARPNPIGLSTVCLFEISCNMLYVGELDILDGSPVLDIEPYVSQYDSYAAQRAAGWMGTTSGKKSSLPTIDSKPFAAQLQK